MKLTKKSISIVSLLLAVWLVISACGTQNIDEYPIRTPKTTSSNSETSSINSTPIESSTDSEATSSTVSTLGTQTVDEPSVVISEVPPPVKETSENTPKTETTKVTKKKEERATNSTPDPPSKSTLGKLVVTFIDVGQADSALVEVHDTDRTYNLLIDSGDWQPNQTLEFLHSKNIKHIDVAVGTHPHADHIGQLDKVINSDVKVDELWMNGDTTTSKVFERVLTAAKNHGLRYEEPRTGDTYKLGNLKITVVHPSSLTGDLNDDSLVLRLEYGKISFLFTGDVEASGEREILTSGLNIKSDILKVAHHGSSTSSTPEFLKKVDPSLAVISYALNSKYHHPNTVTLKSLSNLGIPYLGTGANGNITVTTNGKTFDYKVETKGTVVSGDR